MVAKRTTSRAAKPVAKRVTADGASGGSAEVPGPDTVAGLQLWLDTSDPTTVLNSVSPDVQATDGQTVRRWLDKSGNDYHANNTVASEQPLWRTNQLNGKGALSMDGTNDRLFSTLYSSDASASIFWVLQSTKTAAQVPLAETGNTNTYSLVSEQGSTNNALSDRFGTPTYRINGADAAWVNRGDVYDEVATGSAVVLAAIGCSLLSWSSLAGELILGFSVAAVSWGGLYAALLIYDSPLGASDVATVEQYLANQFGVTLA